MALQMKKTFRGITLPAAYVRIADVVTHRDSVTKSRQVFEGDEPVPHNYHTVTLHVYVNKEEYEAGSEPLMIEAERIDYEPGESMSFETIYNKLKEKLEEVIDV